MGYQYALIKNTLSGIRPTFGKLRHLFQNNQYQTFSLNLESKLHKSWRFYSTIIIIVTPFVISKLIDVWNWILCPEEKPPFYYLTEHNPWYLMFDVFNEGSEYLILFLMSVIIWIMIELTLITKALKEKYEVNIDIFDTDEIGGLKPLRSFVLLVVSNYFIIVTLVIISYITPIGMMLFYTDPKLLITPEIVILILMLLIGIILFITTQKTILDLLDKGVKLELERINRKYKETCDKVIEIISSKGNNDNEKELEKLRIILDILEKEEIKLNRMKHKRFDIRTFITFITTSLLPIITLIKKMGFTSSDISRAITFITKLFSQ